MENGNKIYLLLIVLMAILVIGLVGVSLAFFNYTRTGRQNLVSVGRINFNSTQSGTLNLSNVFPISSTNAASDTDNSGTVSLNIVGDTTYNQGVEYFLTFDAVNNTVNGKKFPLIILLV